MLGLLIAITVLCSLGVLLLGFLVVVGVVLLDRTRHLIPMISQMDAIEGAVLGGAMDFPNGEPMVGPGIFRSIDGKHTASTLEELIDKMNGDPTSKGNVSDLDSLFNGNVDDDDDDEPEENWKKGK
jgi:hypothetical protein